MTGIAQLFASYSGEDIDWFQLAFAFEAMHARLKEYRRTADEKRRHCPRRKAYASKLVTAYQKRKRFEDPQWAARRKAQRKEWDRRYYAKKKAA